MANRPAQMCPQRTITEALALNVLPAGKRAAAQRHLEECEPCRKLFRDQNTECFPSFRNYTITERVGEGGFGVVYKAIHHAKQRTEALKVLFGKTALREAYFQNEVHLVAKLRHPNIATLFDAHLNSAPLYYTMEFIAGEQLDKYFRSHRVPLVDRIRLLQKVVAAVGYAHAAGVVHRDIKPQNILVDARGEPVIVDFGIGKKLGLPCADRDAVATSPEGFLGTFGYVAPEQMAGEVVDERADIYALGALLYHSITGEPARMANDVAHLTHVFQEQRITNAAGLAAIIARCVDPAPENRYPNCTTLLADIENYLAGGRIMAQTDATPASRAIRAAAYVVHHRPALVRGFIILLIGSVLATLAWKVEARWAVSGAHNQTAALVAFTPQTLDAIRSGQIGADVPGLDPKNRKSFRMLQGRLLERIALARPAAVVIDGWYPDCQPQFDPGLLDGIDALRNANVPIVLGADRLDINSEPTGCPEILKRAGRFGVLGAADPARTASQWVLPICIRRPPAPPVPGLAVAAFAAARFPDAIPELEIRGSAAILKYRKQAATPGESHWYEQTDTLPLVGADPTNAEDVFPGGYTFYRTYVPADGGPAIKPISMEQVLLADSSQLLRWFQGRAVVIGDALPGRDHHVTETGENIFGCQIQARAVQALLAGVRVQRMDRTLLVAAIMLWSIAGAYVTNLLPCARHVNLSAAAWLAVGGIVGSVLMVLVSAHYILDLWQLQAILALAALIGCGAPIYITNLVRNRQLQLAPETDWHSDEQTVASTLLATVTDGLLHPDGNPSTIAPASPELDVQPAGRPVSPTACGTRDGPGARACTD
jgi:serine/threonine protein kinase